MNKVTIINLYRHNIVYKIIKNKLKKQLVQSAIVFCTLVFCLCYGKIMLPQKVDNVYTIANEVFNPISPLYSEEGDVMFTLAKGFSYSKDLQFMSPIKSGKYEVIDGVVHYSVNESIMVYAPEGGLVGEVGIANNGNKYIKIYHNEEVYSIIENLDVVGVAKGEVLKKGKEIATAKVGNTLKFSIHNNNGICSIALTNNQIIWN